MHFVSHVHFFSFLCYSFLAVRLVIQTPRQTKNYIAGLSFLCFALWSLSFVFIHHHTISRSQAGIWLDISSIGGLLYPAILLWFSRHLLGRRFRFLTWGITAFGLALVALQFSTHYLARIVGPNPSGPGWNVQFQRNIPGLVYSIYTLTAVLPAMAFPVLVAADSRRRPIERKRSVLVLGGAFVTLGSGLIYGLYAESRGWSDSLFFDSFFLPCAVGIYIAIKKYRLFGPTLESAYRGIVGSMTEAVLLADSEGRITYANNAAYHLFARARPLTNRRIQSVLTTVGLSSNDDLFGPEDYHNRCVSLDSPDDAGLDLLVSRASPGEAVGGSHYLFSDITKHTRAQRELERAERLRALEVFAGGIAHDLNNLLTGIVGYIDLAAQDAISESERRNYLIKARDTFPSMVSLTGRLLAFSKWGYKSSGPTAPAPVLKDAAELGLSGSAISLICDLEENISLVDVDQGQLTQIINNLVVNARQALGNTGIIRVSARNVTITNEKDDSLQKWVRITVEDNGKGMKESVRKRIFEPFFTTKRDGSGLGLATSQSIIERQGGTIEVRSTPGKGTTFILHLPVAEGKGIAETTTIETPSLERAEEEKALVLDDEPGIRMLITDMLGMVGCRVVAVPDGDAAIAAAESAAQKQEPFTLGILDLTIPGGTGAVDIAPTLKSINPGMSLILSTGYSDKSPEEFRYSNVFSAVLNKPYQFRDVKRLLRRIREMRSSSV